MRTLQPEFYARPVLEVARDLIGCVVEHGDVAGTIVETEAYHESEPACHAYIGLTPRTRPLFGPPGRAYVYRSYGIHALFNAVCEPAGVGAAVLIRALEPLRGVAQMQSRRHAAGARVTAGERDLCSGPGKLTQALAIEITENETDLTNGAIRIVQPPLRVRPAVVTAPRIGITHAVDLPWRFCQADSRHLSRPLPDRRGG